MKSHVPRPSIIGKDEPADAVHGSVEKAGGPGCVVAVEGGGVILKIM